MARDEGSPDWALTLLTESPKRIAELTDGLAASCLHDRPTPDGWSVNEALAHLRACADVWGDCIATILAEDGPTLRAVDPRTWVESTDYRDQPFHASFAAFAAQRAGLLAVLIALPPEAWLRAATVTGAGKPLQRTVLTYAQRLARHERSHVKQIKRIVGALTGRGR